MDEGLDLRIWLTLIGVFVVFSRCRSSSSNGTGAGATTTTLVELTGVGSALRAPHTGSAPGQAEHPGRDDVALDLVGSAVDGVGAGEQEQPLQLVEALVAGDGRRRTLHEHRDLTQSLGPARPQQLGDRRLHARLRRGEHPQRGVAQHPKVDPQLGQPVGDERVVDRAGAARCLDDVVELATEADLLAQRRDAALEPERRHGHPPAVAGRPEDVVARRPRTVEEDLVELRRAGDLHNRPDVDAGLLHRHEQVGQPGMLPGVRVGAGQDEAPAGDVRERGPGLLPGDGPLVTVTDRGGAYAGQVGPGTRLGVALAPQLLAREDARKEAPSLLVTAARKERRREQLLADVVDPVRGTRLGVLLAENDLLHQRRAATTVLARPAETDPAVGAEEALPIAPRLEALVIA